MKAGFTEYLGLVIGMNASTLAGITSGYGDWFLAILMFGAAVGCFLTVGLAWPLTNPESCKERIHDATDHQR